MVIKSGGAIRQDLKKRKLFINKTSIMLQQTIEQGKHLLDKKAHYEKVLDKLENGPQYYVLSAPHGSSIYLRNSYPANKKEFDDDSEAQEFEDDMQFIQHYLIVRCEFYINKLNKEIAALQDPPNQMVGLNAKPPAR